MTKIKTKRTCVNTRVLCAHIESLTGIEPIVDDIVDGTGKKRYIINYKGVKVFCHNRGEVQSALSMAQSLETLDHMFDAPKMEIFFGARVCSTGLYWPATEDWEARLEIKVVPFNKTLKEKVNLVFYNRLADFAAKTLQMGKEIHFSAILDPNTRKYQVDKIFLGKDSHKVVKMEIEYGVRPEGWQDVGSDDWKMWQETIKARMAITYNPDSTLYGFAKNKNRNPYM